MIILVNNMTDAFKITTESLTDIKDKIEKMPKNNQIEILRILSKRKNVTLNENKYGVHINLSELQTEIIEELNTYIKYVNTRITMNI